MSAHRKLVTSAPKGSVVVNVFIPSANVEIQIVFRSPKNTQAKQLISFYDTIFAQLPCAEYVKSKI